MCRPMGDAADGTETEWFVEFVATVDPWGGGENELQHSLATWNIPGPEKKKQTQKTAPMNYMVV